MHRRAARRGAQVWFAGVPATTMYRCMEFIVCVPPKFSEIFPNQYYCLRQTPVPLSLVRPDGVVYTLDHCYVYEKEPPPM